MKKASQYKTATPAEHVLIRPAMYVGSCKREKRKEWHLINSIAQYINTEVPLGMIQLFKELVSNVGDNTLDSRDKNIDPGECSITVKRNKVSITNGGLCIPIKKNKSGVYIPQTIFGSMLSGSNLGEKRKGGGAHGIGAKAAAILSILFNINIKNSIQGLSYSQTWHNNLSVCDTPIITKYDGEESFITVSYIIDHNQFGYTEDKFRYEASAINIFRWVASCLSLTANIPVIFNGERMEYDIKSFAKLYIEDFDQFPKHLIVKTENIQCIILDTPGDGKSIGFANHIINSAGGVHVNAPISAIKEFLKNNKLLANGKGGEPPKITVKDIKPHLTVIISAIRIVDPDFGGGQTKTSLTSPHIKVEIPSRALNKLKEWSMLKNINRSIKSKIFKDFGKIEPATKKGKYLLNVHGEDAGWAGTKRSSDAELHVVEGDSAEGYDANLLDFIPDGRDKVGTLTLRGKPLNVLKASDESIEKNPELIEISRRLGLNSELDYTIEKNIKTLRYGKLVIMADADLDGHHIKTIILAFFYRFYPSLLKVRGFVVDRMTPYIRATKGNKLMKFFYEAQFEHWKKSLNNNIKGWSIRYLKGLGQSLREDIEDDQKDCHVVKLIYDKNAPIKIEMAMTGGEDAVALRKKWMLEWDPNNFGGIKHNKLPISEFIDYFLRSYSFSTLSRNMPSMIDGLTNVARKILFGAFHAWGRKCTSKKLIKVSNFGGEVGTLTAYHHGDAIQHSVINAGQEFPGSNNLPILKGKGRFGSMEKGGKHAAEPRYLEVNASSLLPLIFHPDDDSLLIEVVSEGQKIEPQYYIPIIPMSMVNGVNSVSTGWRSYIPNYHPLEIIDAYLSRLDGNKFVELLPWYRDYEGEIYLEDSDTDDIRTFVSRGIIEEATENSYTVTCLPVGVWNNSYKKFLMKKVFREEIKSYKSMCTATKTFFKVKNFNVTDEGGNIRPLTIDDVNITRRERLSNITLVGMNGFPIEYSSIVEVMEDFYNHRLPLYKKRQNNIISSLKKDLCMNINRMKYITACIDGTLLFRLDNKAMKRSDILDKIDKLSLCKGFYVHTDGYRIVDQCEMDIEGINKLMDAKEEIIKKITETETWTEQTMWRADLKTLRKAYITMYPNDGRKIYI